MANTWTEEQLMAIEKSGTNIIVSAGAGSGKTAVLSERVLQKVLQGTSINEFLIMTFTNAAAKEMKDRIRKKLKKEHLEDQVNLIDSAYITTFDSFSLSLVKKYHYLLNMPKNISITDASLLTILKKKIMEEVFEEYYLRNDDEKFREFIHHFCTKDDDKLKKLLIKLSDTLDMRMDADYYLENYISNYYQDKIINDNIKQFYQEIKLLIGTMEEDMDILSHHLDSDTTEKFYQKLNPLFYSKNYDEVIQNIPDARSLQLPRNLEDEEAKEIKTKMGSTLTSIKEMCICDNSDQIKKELKATKEDVEIILTIIKKYRTRLQKAKKEENKNSFLDISKLAIQLVEENEEIREELKSSFKEIMLDEYQDTNDIQEYFVSLISNHNVYMVGDIKQSIYRFRNANPYIFKNKYDEYTIGKEGLKIDLLKNFRSRDEVLNNINLIFNDLMDDRIGGADYKTSHQMVFGNFSYHKEGKTEQNYDFEIFSYDDIDSNFTKSEKEIFLIGEDIKKKIKSHYLIFDKDEKIKREVSYRDFVILLDRSSDFDLYKKIFEYLNIPLTLYKEEEVKNHNDIFLIKNILKMIQAIDKEEYKEEFQYCFFSLGRSFLFHIDDEVLFDYFYKENFKDSVIFEKCLKLYDYYYEISFKAFFLKLLEIFQWEEKLITIGNVEIGRKRLEYFYNLAESLENIGKTAEDFIAYLEEILESEDKVSFSLNHSDSNSVKIMTIHKSKGLEYPICYFAGFTKEFSFKELNDPILYSNHLGIITPYFQEYKKDTIYKMLLTSETKQEEISEKIRLLYVALTRAKEKIIMVLPDMDTTKGKQVISYQEKRKIKSFYDMLVLIYPKIKGYIIKKEANYTKDYLKRGTSTKLRNLEKEEKLTIKEIFIPEEEQKESKFSKSLSFITKEDRRTLDLGIRIHELLEFTDFQNPDYSYMTDFEARKVKSFLESDFIKKRKNAKYYKEYEFSYSLEEEVKHGMIDLLIEEEDKITIVDYKLKNTNDSAYYKQLEGYQNYIHTISDKEVDIYLYSILEERIEKVPEKI